MKLKRTEIILLAVLILALSAWALWPKSEGNAATVTINGETVQTVALNEDGRYPFAGYGGFSLTVVVEDGSAWVEDSDCPDLVCQNHAPISQSGEQIVCLPHRLVVSITGEEAQIDAVAG